jgi:hypothetical protein
MSMRRVLVKVVVACAALASGIVGSAGEAAAAPSRTEYPWERIGPSVIEAVQRSRVAVHTARAVVDKVPSRLVVSR